MPQLFLVFHLSCASGCLVSLSFVWSYISPHILRGLWESCSLSFLFSSSLDDDICGFFGFLVCFAMLIVLCWIISVMLLFGLSMSSRSFSVMNQFFSSS